MTSSSHNIGKLQFWWKNYGSLSMEMALILYFCIHARPCKWPSNRQISNKNMLKSEKYIRYQNFLRFCVTANWRHSQRPIWDYVIFMRTNQICLVFMCPICHDVSNENTMFNVNLIGSRLGWGRGWLKHIHVNGHFDMYLEICFINTNNLQL
jgi:hypothetical protein